MWWNALWQRWQDGPRTGRRPSARRRPRVRLSLEPLEDRTVPSNYTAATVPELIAAIDAANQTADADTIVLAAGSRFTLTEVNNTTNGPTGLPTIAAGEDLSILGNNDIIERSTATGAPAFRLFDVAAGASLRLENLTLQGGWAFGSGVSAQGGAIHNQGMLTLKSLTVQNNIAEHETVWKGSPSASAAGGAIYSSGSLTVQGGTLQNNRALGYHGLNGSGTPGGPGDGDYGGAAFGGGLYIAGGATLLTGVTVSANTAQGGDGGNGQDGSRRFEGGWGGNGGIGFGGGLYAAAGTMELHNVTITTNSAQGGGGGKGGSGNPRGKDGAPGLAVGGGVCIDPTALACLDAFTVDHLKRNKASTSDPNIHGSYTVCP
jgi:hypothetical protein